MAQSVERPTSAQVTISRSVSSSPASGSVLTAQSLEPVSGSVSLSLSSFKAGKERYNSFSLISNFTAKIRNTFFKNFYLFLIDRKRKSTKGGGAEREGDT